MASSHSTDTGTGNPQGEGSGSSSDVCPSSSSPNPPPPKSWLVRSLGALQQLPRWTPPAVLRWTTPEGPMPEVIYLPSRDDGRAVEVYMWLPPCCSMGSSSDAASKDATTTQRPCLVDFHGGGFIMGEPLEQAPWCASLARSGVIALSVGYRMGPTWEFPAALQDAEDVVAAVLFRSGRAGQYLRQEIDRAAGEVNRMSIDEDKVALSGSSSGGNMALNLLLSLSKDVMKHSEPPCSEAWPSPFPPTHRPPIPALLFFPSLDARQPSYERKRPVGVAPATGLAKFIGRTMKDAYLPANNVGHPRASPALAPVSALHPSTRALLILPELDTLAEQSKTYIDKLQEAGMVQQAENDTGQTIAEPLLADRPTIRVHQIKGVEHGFTTYPDAMLDVETRKIKALVLEQARRWVVAMLGLTP